MKKYVIIFFILIFIFLFCIKSSVFGEISRYDFYLILDSVIENIKNDINNNEETQIMNEKYFKVIQLKNDFIKECKDERMCSYYNDVLNKICIYVVTGIFEKNIIWLNESKFLLQATFRYIYFIK